MKNEDVTEIFNTLSMPVNLESFTDHANLDYDEVGNFAKSHDQAEVPAETALELKQSAILNALKAVDIAHALVLFIANDSTDGDDNCGLTEQLRMLQDDVQSLLNEVDFMLRLV